MMDNCMSRALSPDSTAWLFGEQPASSRSEIGRMILWEMRTPSLFDYRLTVTFVRPRHCGAASIIVVSPRRCAAPRPCTRKKVHLPGQFEPTAHATRLAIRRAAQTPPKLAFLHDRVLFRTTHSALGSAPCADLNSDGCRAANPCFT